MTRRIGAAVAAAFTLAGPAPAQTDYYNTDEGRPVRVEDALPVERHAFEVQLAPVRLERGSGGVYHWEFEPELAYGILPRTHVEIGVPLRYADAGGGTLALAGISLAALHNLNAETALPALALAADVVLPVGGMAPERARASLTGIATRTLPFARFHANGRVTFGEAGDSPGEASRWMAGVAVDRAVPLRSLLLTADVFAEQPLEEGVALAWTAEAGFRYQTSPHFTVDLGAGRRFTGPDPAWFLTFGLARSFAVRSLIH